MIFGIKTKKDKRIEELENALLDISRLQIPTIISPKLNACKVIAQVSLREGMPAEYAKRIIRERLMDNLDKFIQYDLIDVDRQQVLKGCLYVYMKEVRNDG